MSNSLPDIAKVYKRGFFDFRHIDAVTYDLTRAEFMKEGIELPTWRGLKKFGNPADVRLMLSDLTIDIKFKDKTGFRYDFRRGYITDLASVPSYFRSLVDNDDVDMLAAALVHDRGFAVHNLTFGQTNELFYKMFLARGGVPGSDGKWVSLPWRARFAWWAVKSVFGRIRWRRNKKRRHDLTLSTSRFVTLKYGK